MADDGANVTDKEDRNMTFDELKLNDWLLKQISSLGISKPSPIQYNCIPEILKGRDCIGCAKTGSGKTFAFALPILQSLCQDPYGIFALILTPTRELAFQIAEQFRVLGKPIGLRDSVITGGLDMVLQGKELASSPHIVVATPGRLADHLQTCNTFSLKKIKYLVMDEADRLLEGPFNDQLKVIFNALPTQRQTLLFSATINDALEQVKHLAMKEPFFYETTDVVVTVDKLDQRYVLAPQDVKEGYMVQVILDYRKKYKDTSIVVFTNTCKSCQIMAMMLKELGFECVSLHSMIRQKERLASLARFKSNIVKILLATDVASRGLDIPQVELVINHFIPSIPKDYVHRVGRTARAGRGGMAISLITRNDIPKLHAVEDFIKTKLTEHKVDDKEVLKILTQVSVAKRESEIRLDTTDFDEKRGSVEKMKMKAPNEEIDFGSKLTHNKFKTDIQLDSEYKKLLEKVRFVRVMVEVLKLSIRPPKPSWAPKVKKSIVPMAPSNFLVEYMFPLSKETSKSKSEKVQISARKVQDNVIVFNHRTVFPVSIDARTMKHWSKSVLKLRIFFAQKQKIVEFGTVSFDLKSVLESTSLSVTSNLPIIHSERITEISSTLQEFNLETSGHLLKVKVELASDERGFYSSLASLKYSHELLQPLASPDTCVQLEDQTTENETKQVSSEISLEEPRSVFYNLKTDSKNKPSSNKRQETNVKVSYEEKPVTVISLLSVSHGHGFIPPVHMPSVSSINKENRRITRNLYVECRMFNKDDVSRSPISWSSLNPVFNFRLICPVLLNQAFLQRTWNNYIILEVWDQRSATDDQLVGICKIPLHQLFLSFRNRSVTQVLFQTENLLVAVDGYLPVNDVVTCQDIGHLHVFFAFGSREQINKQVTMLISENDLNREKSIPMFISVPMSLDQETLAADQTKASASQRNISPTKQTGDIHSPNVEHSFIVYLEEINSLHIPKNIWAEADCYVQYSFPTGVRNGKLVMQKSSSSPCLCSSDITLGEKHYYSFRLPAGDNLLNTLRKACPNGIEFSVWFRKYHPKISDHFVAKAVLPLSYVCSLFTLWKQKQHTFRTASLSLQRKTSKSSVVSAGLLKVSLSYNSKTMQETESYDEEVTLLETSFKSRFEDSRNASGLSGIDESLKDSMQKSPSTPMLVVPPASLTRTRFETVPKSVSSSVPYEERVTTLDNNEVFQALVQIEEAVLERSYDDSETSVCVDVCPTEDSDNFPTQWSVGTQSFKWNWDRTLLLPTELLVTPQKSLLFKVWCRKPSGADVLVGFASVEITVLTVGMSQVSGWYNITDYKSRCLGQLKVTISPLEDLSRWKMITEMAKNKKTDDPMTSTSQSYVTTASYSSFPSHITQYAEQKIVFESTGKPSLEDLRKAAEADLANFAHGNLSDKTRSFLITHLTRSLSDLEGLCTQMKSRNLQNGNILHTRRLISPSPNKGLTVRKSPSLGFQTNPDPYETAGADHHLKTCRHSDNDDAIVDKGHLSTYSNGGTGQQVFQTSLEDRVGVGFQHDSDVSFISERRYPQKRKTWQTVKNHSKSMPQLNFSRENSVITTELGNAVKPWKTLANIPLSSQVEDFAEAEPHQIPRRLDDRYSTWDSHSCKVHSFANSLQSEVHRNSDVHSAADSAAVSGDLPKYCGDKEVGVGRRLKRTSEDVNSSADDQSGSEREVSNENDFAFPDWENVIPNVLNGVSSRLLCQKSVDRGGNVNSEFSPEVALGSKTRPSGFGSKNDNIKIDDFEVCRPSESSGFVVFDNMDEVKATGENIGGLSKHVRFSSTPENYETSRSFSLRREEDNEGRADDSEKYPHELLGRTCFDNTNSTDCTPSVLSEALGDGGRFRSIGGPSSSSEAECALRLPRVSKPPRLAAAIFNGRKSSSTPALH